MYNMSEELLAQSKERYTYSIECRQFEDQIDALISKGNIVEAQAECISVSDDKVLGGTANYSLGRILTSQRKDEEAIAAFQKSFDNDYKRIESLDGIAATHFRRGEYEEAIKWYNAVQEEKGYDAKIWCNIGICYIHLKQYEKAVEYFDKAITEEENDAYPYYNKGVALYKLKDYDLAKLCMKKAIVLDPGNEFYKNEYLKNFPIRGIKKWCSYIRRRWRRSLSNGLQ